MIAGTIESVNRAALERLLDHAVAECRTLEYKRDAPDFADRKAKHEFLADVTAFANGQGGDLFFGIDAPRGVPLALTGLTADDPDALLLRWEAIVQDGCEPRLPGLQLRWIKIDEARGAVLIRIAASPVGPHRVIAAGANRFYARRSAGKYELDTHELREAFTLSEVLPARLHRLHLEAIDRTLHDGFPATLGGSPTAIVSLLPLSLFRERLDLDITAEFALTPFHPNGYLEAYEMVEGVMLASPSDGPESPASLAVTYREGRIDAAWTIGRRINPLRHSEAALVWPGLFEQGLIDAALSGASRLGAFGIAGPWLIHASLAGIRDYQLVLGDKDLSAPAWRDEVHLPAFRAERLDAVSLEPLMQAFWRAFGMRRPRTATS